MTHEDDHVLQAGEQRDGTWGKECWKDRKREVYFCNGVSDVQKQISLKIKHLSQSPDFTETDEA